MTTTPEFAKNFGAHPVPEALAQLLKFQEATGFENYSEGFGLQHDDKSGLEHGWSDHPDFLGRLYPFAQANGSGSFYALWQHDEATDLSELPVVVFGDEGGEFVIAENVASLLQLITFDSEPIIYEEITFYKEEDDEPSEYIDAYKEWLLTQLKLEPVEDTADIIAKAQEKHQVAFDTWKQQYFG